MPTPTPPYQFIAIARTIARGFTEQAIGRPDGEALTEAAQANWRGIEVLPRRVPPTLCPHARNDSARFARPRDDRQSYRKLAERVRRHCATT